MSRLVRTLKLATVVVACAWIATIIVLIAKEPAPGAPSPEDLAAQLAQALQAEDADRLAPLLSLEEDGESAAKATVDSFDAVDAKDIQVHPVRQNGRTRIAVDFVRGDGTPGTVHMPAVQDHGKWKITPVAAP